MALPKGMVSAVIWSSLFGYLMLCAFVLMIPNMDEAAKQGWNVFFWAMGAQVPEGIRNAHSEIEDLVTLARSACTDGMVIRDQVAASSTALLASAVAVATRRIVAEWYDADPARTSAICIEALRAASGQDILSVRVHPSVASQVQAALGNSGTYVRASDAVDVGGCIIDIAGGTLDASLDTRLSLLELGLQRTAGGAQ